jgi:hypothetical protein
LSLTQSWCIPTVQQSGFIASLAHSDFVVQRCNVSVAWQVNVKLEVQDATHCVDSDSVVQFGSMPPLTTSVPQHTEVLPGQSLAVPHASVFAGLHVAWQDPLPVPGS